VKFEGKWVLKIKNYNIITIRYYNYISEKIKYSEIIPAYFFWGEEAGSHAYS
jgi:hypothetical protein